MSNKNDVVSEGGGDAESFKVASPCSKTSNEAIQEAIQQAYEEPQPPVELYDSFALLLGFVDESARQFKSGDTKSSD